MHEPFERRPFRLPQGRWIERTFRIVPEHERNKSPRDRRIATDLERLADRLECKAKPRGDVARGRSLRYRAHLYERSNGWIATHSQQLIAETNDVAVSEQVGHVAL